MGRRVCDRVHGDLTPRARPPIAGGWLVSVESALCDGPAADIVSGAAAQSGWQAAECLLQPANARSYCNVEYSCSLFKVFVTKAYIIVRP